MIPSSPRLVAFAQSECDLTTPSVNSFFEQRRRKSERLVRPLVRYVGGPARKLTGTREEPMEQRLHEEERKVRASLAAL